VTGVESVAGLEGVEFGGRTHVGILEEKRGRYKFGRAWQ
jgi:hypothetical protein